MQKNDYRRAFIMLRSAAPGYGGHARLERRTLTGSLYFIVTAPEGAGPLSAALVGRQGAEYYAAQVGPFTRDRRGQLTLAWPFDPRDIDGRPLEAYAWTAVAEAEGGRCAVVLTGNVNGSREVDPAALEAAVCRLFTGERAPAADLPDPDATADSDMKIYRSIRSRAAEAAGAIPANAEPEPAEPAPSEAEIVSEQLSEPAEAEIVPEPTPLPAPEEALAEYVEAEDAPCAGAPVTAARVLGLDITAPWPEPAEPLRRLFATQAPAGSPLGDGYTYVAAPLPKVPGDCLVGLRSEDGRISGIRYALPGVYAPEPPAGLDDYLWNAAGYWVLDIGVS